MATKTNNMPGQAPALTMTKMRHKMPGQAPALTTKMMRHKMPGQAPALTTKTIRPKMLGQAPGLMTKTTRPSLTATIINAGGCPCRDNEGLALVYLLKWLSCRKAQFDKQNFTSNHKKQGCCVNHV